MWSLTDSRAVTHLVVEPPHRSDLGRLVPVELVDADGRVQIISLGATGDVVFEVGDDIQA